MIKIIDFSMACHRQRGGDGAGSQFVHFADKICQNTFEQKNNNNEQKSRHADEKAKHNVAKTFLWN